MIREYLNKYMLFHYGDCKKKIEEQEEHLDRIEKIISENQSSRNKLLAQIEELKAIYNYKTKDLENKITELESQMECDNNMINKLNEENESLTCHIEELKNIDLVATVKRKRKKYTSKK